MISFGAEREKTEKETEVEERRGSDSKVDFRSRDEV